MVDGILDSLAHQSLGGERGNRLDAQAGLVEKGRAHFLAQEFGQLDVLGRAGLVFDAGVDVFGVLAEDDHVHLFGMAHRRGHAGVVAHRADAGIQIQILTQRHIQRTEATADRSGQRALDGDDQFLDGLQGFVGEVVAVVNFRRLLAQKDFAPVDLALAAISFLDRRVPDPQRGPGDIRTDAIAFHIADDGLIGNV